MSFNKKYAKFKRDPELFFQDSITKQYSKAYKFLNSIKSIKRGVSKALLEIRDDKIAIPSSNDSSTSPFHSASKKQLKDRSKGLNEIQKDITVSVRSKNLVNAASTIIENVRTNVHVDKKKDFKDYFEEVVVFTEQYDVNSLKLDGKNIWPHLRNNLWIHMNFVAIGKNNYKNVTSVHIHNSHRVQIPQSYRIKAIDSYGAKEVKDLNDNDKADILFIVAMNASEQVHLDSGIYHRVCDPLFEAATKVATTKKIEVVKSASPAIARNKDFINPATIILPPVIEKVGYSERIEFDKKIFSLMKQFMPSLNTLNTAALKEIVDYDMNIKDFYLDIFKKINPKVVFFYAFHYNAPMIEAADELGILTVDIQHGLQVGWNPLYTNYDEMPPEGYSQIPDYFAVWGEKEYQSILNSFPSEKHRPIYMGNPWLEKIKTFPTCFTGSILDKLQSDEYDKKILIIMQNQTNIPQTFKDIIEDTRNDDILWVIRHHPKGERYKPEDFSKENSNIILSDEIDKVLFSELFKYVDITISEGSTLAIEASYFGVTNIVTSAMGADNYKDEIRDKLFYYLKDSSGFREILDSLDSNKNKVDTSYLFKKVNTEDLVKSLLEAADVKINRLVAKDENTVTKARQHKNNIEAEVAALIEKAHYFAEHYDLMNAVSAFKELRSLLVKLPTARKDYDKEQMLCIKEARVFKRKIKSEFNIVPNEEDVVLIGDSLILPRPLETKNVNFGMSRSYAYMFNKSSHGFTLLPWAQRNLNTSKLLEKWDSIVGNLIGKHLIIHLGTNDYTQSVFSEEQQSAMNSLSPDIRKRILDFVQNYHKEITESQSDFSHVSYNEFNSNVESIAIRALDEGVKSLTFIGINPLTQSQELTSSRAIKNCKKYNSVLRKVAEEYDFVSFLDISEVLSNVKKNSALLSDNLHLSMHGHKALASTIFSKLSILYNSNKVYRIALIGVGDQGVKHLLGLAKANNNLIIECFDPNQENISIAIRKFKKAVGDNNITLRFVDSREDLSDEIDLAIVATHSNIRAQVLEELLIKHKVRNLILESIVFHDTASYHKLKDLIEEKKVKTWINHPRRQFDFYKVFLAEIRYSKKLLFQVSGVNWGLVNNGLNFLDLLTWLTNIEQESIELEWNKIGRSVAYSKQSQFKEVYGTISGIINDDISFSIASLPPVKNEVQFPIITVVSDTIKLFIDESNGIVNYALISDGWTWHTLEDEVPLFCQSQITETVIDRILDEGECELPSYNTAMWLHIPFIRTIEQGIEKLES